MVILITGASSGIGLACANHLASLGHTVYGASRSIASLADPVTFERLTLDVCDESSVINAINTVHAREGRIDALICAAGFGIAGPIEATSLADAQEQFDINFFGVVRTCQAVIPIMRAQQSGYILAIGSLGGISAIPFQGFYSASKFALEGYMESLRMELRPFGIRTVLIEPGDYKTAFTTNRRESGTPETIAPYEAAYRRALAVMAKDEQNGPDAIGVAHLAATILNAPNPRLRYTCGPFAERLAIQLKRVLPHTLYQRLIQTYYQI